MRPSTKMTSLILWAWNDPSTRRHMEQEKDDTFAWLPSRLSIRNVEDKSKEDRRRLMTIFNRKIGLSSGIVRCWESLVVESAHFRGGARSDSFEGARNKCKKEIISFTKTWSDEEEEKGWKAMHEPWRETSSSRLLHTKIAASSVNNTVKLHGMQTQNITYIVHSSVSSETKAF